MSTVSDSYLFVAGGVGVTFTLPIYLSLMDRCAANVQFVVLTRTVNKVDWIIDYICKAKLPVNAQVDMEMYITKTADKSELVDVCAETQKVRLQVLRIRCDGGKPPMSGLVRPSFASGDGKVTVLCCGPKGLTRPLRAEIGRYVQNRGREVDWHEESFGLRERGLDLP